MQSGCGAGLVPGGAIPDVQPLVSGEEAVLGVILNSPGAVRAVPGPDNKSGNGTLSNIIIYHLSRANWVSSLVSLLNGGHLLCRRG